MCCATDVPSPSGSDGGLNTALWAIEPDGPRPGSAPDHVAALKELAGLLPACVTTVRRLRATHGFHGEPGCDRVRRVVGAFADRFDPEFLPVIGPPDDIVVVALALRYAARRVPRDVLVEAWPAKPATLERLLGTAKPTSSQANSDQNSAIDTDRRQ